MNGIRWGDRDDPPYTGDPEIDRAMFVNKALTMIDPLRESDLQIRRRGLPLLSKGELLVAYAMVAAVPGVGVLITWWLP